MSEIPIVWVLKQPSTNPNISPKTAKKESKGKKDPEATFEEDELETQGSIIFIAVRSLAVQPSDLQSKKKKNSATSPFEDELFSIFAKSGKDKLIREANSPVNVSVDMKGVTVLKIGRGQV
jgi:hypothetical protein